MPSRRVISSGGQPVEPREHFDDAPLHAEIALTLLDPVHRLVRAPGGERMLGGLLDHACAASHSAAVACKLAAHLGCEGFEAALQVLDEERMQAGNTRSLPTTEVASRWSVRGAPRTSALSSRPLSAVHQRRVQRLQGSTRAPAISTAAGSRPSSTNARSSARCRRSRPDSPATVLAMSLFFASAAV